jgi:hypothetical protein
MVHAHTTTPRAYVYARTHTSLFVQVMKIKWCWRRMKPTRFYFKQFNVQSNIVLPYFKHWQFQK